jgi:hypothetical protein
MSIRRRDFLLGTGACSAGLIPCAAALSAPVRVALISDDPKSQDVAALFEEAGLTCDAVAVSDAGKADPARHALLWLTCPSYPLPAEFSPRMAQKIEEFLARGKGVFAEFALNFPGAPCLDTPQKTGIARLFVSSVLEAVPGKLPSGTILDEHDSVCVPFTGEALKLREVLSFGKVPGVQRIITTPERTATWPGLVCGVRATGRFGVAATSISQFGRREYAPRAHWERFLVDLILWILPEQDRNAVLNAYVPCRVHTEPRSWVLPGSGYQLVIESSPAMKVRLQQQDPRIAVETAPGRYEVSLRAGASGISRLTGSIAGAGPARTFEATLRVAGRKEAYRRALDRNIRWFERSGVMPRSDGSLGVTEWISGPDSEGNRIPYGKGQIFSWERADCVFESALAMCLYGKLASSARHTTIGHNMMRRIMDFQRLERGDRFYGLWYTRGRSGPVYQDDIAMAIIFSLAGYRFMRDPLFLKRGVMAAEASVPVFAGEVPEAAGSADPKHAHPHERGQMLAAWLYAYSITGDRRFSDQAVPLLRRMVDEYPKIPRFLISRTGESSRFLLPLALGFACTGDVLFGSALREQARYLRSRMAPCGAIQEDGSNTGSRLSGTDLGLTYDQSETVSDQLYTTSFAAMNYWIAYKATGEASYLEDYFRVADYLVRIQVDSPNQRIDGGWMRGFDYSLWEYYGSNADQSWTAYCMETGWTNAIIDIALALYLVDDTFYEPRPAAAPERQSGRS